MRANNNTLIVVSAYAGDQHQVETNLPFYLHHNCPILILSPEDRPVIGLASSQICCQSAGEAEWAGLKSLVRHRLFLEAMLQFPQDWFLMHDADTVCLAPELPEYLYQEKAAWSNEVFDPYRGVSRLRKIATQPPYFFHRDVLAAMLLKVDHLPISYPGEITGYPNVLHCIDHYHHRLSAECGFPQKSFPDGASWETASEIGLQEMCRRVREGAVFIHQVKSKRALDTLRDVYTATTRPRLRG